MIEWIEWSSFLLGMGAGVIVLSICFILFYVFEWIYSIGEAIKNKSKEAKK